MIDNVTLVISKRFLFSLQKNNMRFYNKRVSRKTGCTLIFVTCYILKKWSEEDGNNSKDG